MTTPTPTIITITDRNESKYLTALGFTGTPAPRDAKALDFSFIATEELFQARREYSLNYPIPVLSFVSASKQVDKAIYIHRHQAGGTK